MMYVTRAEIGVAPTLNLGAVYERVLGASIERVWENVFDWEHLPYAHESTFSQIELLERDADGWKVAVSRPWRPDDRIVIQLDARRDVNRFCSRILAGTGAGTEVWNLLAPVDEHRTAIEVRFYLPIDDAKKLAAVGQAWRDSHAFVWNEDEAMCQRREALAGWSPRPLPFEAVPLGPVEDLRRRLPLDIEVDGRPLRIAALGDELIVYSTVCPHWRGPLAACGEDQLRCPWHGYRFDLRTGMSLDGRYRLAPAARIEIDPAGEALLVPIEDVWRRVSRAAIARPPGDWLT